MNNEQSNSASHICTQLAPQIFRFPPILFAHTEWPHLNSHALIGWTKRSKGQNYYNLFVLILYHDYEGYNDIQKAFLNQLLFDVSTSSILHIQC